MMSPIYSNDSEKREIMQWDMNNAMDGKTEAQEGTVTCPKLHSR